MWNLAIRRAVTFTMLFLAIIGIGIVSLLRLSPELLPNMSIPIAGVIATYSGVGTEEIENLVTKPIEGAVATVTNVSEITSTVREGQSMTLIQFAWGTDMDVAASDIREKVDMIRRFLPEEVEKPLVIKFDPTMMPVMVIALSGGLPTWELRRIAEDEISPRIERIEGVAKTTIMGGLKREIQVNLDRRRLEAYGVSVNAITQVLGASNLAYPGGSVGVGTRDYTVRTRGEFETVKQIENVVISYANGAPIRIGDVAEVKDAFEDRLTDMTINGIPGVGVMVNKTSGAVTVDVSNKVKKELSRIDPALMHKCGTPGVITEVVMDQAKYINKAIGNTIQTAILGSILAVLVLFMFLFNFGSTIIIALSIPISIVTTFIVMDALNITLNIISMMGLALAIGMLVDSAIVVLENVFRHREEGMGMREAASFGTGEVAIPVIASIMTTIAVFLPIIFVPGMTGIMFRDLSLTVTISLLVSLFMALTLVPLLCSRFLRLRQKESGIASSSPRNDSKMDKLEGKVKLFLYAGYERWLNWCLDHKRMVVFGTVGLFFLSIFIVWPLRFLGTEFIPKMDQGMLTMKVELPAGTKLETTKQVVTEVESILRKEVPEIKIIHSTVGGSGMEIVLGGGGQTHMGEVELELVDLAERDRTQWEIEEAIRPKLSRIPGAEITFGGAEQHMMMMGTSEAPISIEICGYDIAEAEKIAKQVKDIVADVPGTKDIKISLEKSMPEFNVTVNRDKASALGLQVALVADAISSTIRGKVATRFREGGDEFNVKVRIREEDRESFEDLANIPIFTPSRPGGIPLSSVAYAKPALGPLTIDRKGQQRLVTVSCDYVGTDLGGVVRKIDERLSGLTLPTDFSIKMGGEAKEQRESFKWLALALIGAILLVYAVMASLFESFRDPFIIMLTFPMSVIGVIWLLFLTNTTFGVIAFIGLVLLAGIIVNNGIVMVHYISLLRSRDKLGVREAVVLGGRRRLRPVLMTTLTTIFGMLPLAMGIGEGAEIRMPMARAVIGGLTVGTFLTLFIIPVIYAIIEKKDLKNGIRRP